MCTPPSCLVILYLHITLHLLYLPPHHVEVLMSKMVQSLNFFSSEFLFSNTTLAVAEQKSLSGKHIQQQELGNHHLKQPHHIITLGQARESAQETDPA